MSITVRAVPGLPDLEADDDLVALLLATGPELVDGDVLTVSSKAVAKVEGRVTAGTREDLLDAETDRDVARRGPLRIARTHHGLVLAAAGVDASNTAPGTVVPLPSDPDGSARRLRDDLADRAGRNVGVVVTDTAGRAWRTGQTDIAVGCAGIEPVLDLAGRPDAAGRPLAVTAPAVADELAGAAELVLAKAARTPVAVVSGLARLVLPAGQHGPGAVAIVRPEADDLFGLGATDAVRAAIRRSPVDVRGFAVPSAGPGDAHGDGLAELVRLAGDGIPDVAVELACEPTTSVVLVRPAHGRTESDTAVLLGAGAVGERLRVLAWTTGLLPAPTAPARGVVAAWSVHPHPYTGR